MTVHMKGKQEISCYEPQSNFLSVNRVNEARDTLIPRDAYLFRPDRTPYSICRSILLKNLRALLRSITPRNIL